MGFTNKMCGEMQRRRGVRGVKRGVKKKKKAGRTNQNK